jgi:hypothetical protein
MVEDFRVHPAAPAPWRDHYHRHPHTESIRPGRIFRAARIDLVRGRHRRNSLPSSLWRRWRNNVVEEAIILVVHQEECCLCGQVRPVGAQQRRGDDGALDAQRYSVSLRAALADAFTVCDAYYCSLLGPTDPNRYHMWTGWVGNDGSGGGPVIDNAEAGYGWSTFPERLESAGISWKIYPAHGQYSRGRQRRRRHWSAIEGMCGDLSALNPLPRR